MLTRAISRFRFQTLVAVLLALILCGWFGIDPARWGAAVENTVRAAPGDSGILIGQLDTDFNPDIFYKSDVFMWSEKDKVWKVYLSTGSGWNAETWAGAWGSDGPIHIGDLNRDDKTDVFMWRDTDKVWTVNLSTGSGWNAQTWTGAWGSDGPISVGDLNGDRMLDVFMWRNADKVWTVNLSTGSGWNAQTWTGAWGSDGPIHVGDLNGDRRADVFMWRDADKVWTVNLSNGTGFDAQIWTGDWGSDGPINIGDLNGDGRTDVFMWRDADKVWTVNLSTGSGFDPQIWTGAWGSDGPINVGDLNGDRKADVFMWRGDVWTVNISNGNGFDPAMWPGGSGADGAHVGNFDGIVNRNEFVDVAMFHPHTKTWTVNLSTGSGWNVQTWKERPRYVPHAPYDLISDTVDDNGFPLNPRWGKQEKYLAETGLRDLWVKNARPHIYADCLNHAEEQTVIGVGNDYNPFQNGYCKHSPGATDYRADYCRGETPAPFQPSGPIYCASWSWKDEPFAYKCLTSPFNIPYHLEGHLNFSVATYDGVLRWDNAQAEYNFDSDWCMNLYTPHGAGVSGRKENEPWIHAEVDPKEVGDGFDRGFWKTFRDNIHNGQLYCGDLQYCSGTTDAQNRTVAPMINGKRAIIIGLVGLDMGHEDAGAELHPIYGLAIHNGGRTLSGSECTWNDGHCSINDDVYLHPERDRLFDVPQDPNDDPWAIWVANYGSEGYCSTRATHVLDGDESIIGRKELPTLSIRLPWAKDMSGQPMANVEVLDNTNFALHARDIGRTDAVYDVAVNRGENIIVTFHMWPSDARPYWFGELHLKWTPAPAPFTAMLFRPPVPLAPSTLGAELHTPPESEENPTMAQMNDAQKRIFLAEMKKSQKTAPILTKVAIVGTRRSAPPPPAASVQPQAHIIDKSFTTEDNTVVKRALCAAYGGHVPDVSADFCWQELSLWGQYKDKMMPIGIIAFILGILATYLLFRRDQ